MGKKKRYQVQPFETPKLNEHFTSLHDTLLESKAFKGLTNSAKVTYMVMKKEYKGDYTGNLIKCPYVTLEEYGLSRPTISKAIKELTQAGFIEIEKQGGLYRQATTYKLSAKWYINSS